MMKPNLAITVLTCFFSLAQPALGEKTDYVPSDSAFVEAIKETKPIIDLRYRYERKSQAGFAEHAYANTFRTRLGFETGEFAHLSFLVEFENVLSIGSDHYNSTTNGLTQFPVIADPEETELNRAQVTFTGIDKTPITVGRQRFNLNNHRFVGAVDFRQNQQTFDAVRISSTIIDRLAFDYLYIARVNRIFGDRHPLGEFDSNSHIISAAFDGSAFGTLKTYGILLDLEEAPAASTATWGLRYENSHSLETNDNVSLAVAAEYATQRDYANNPLDYREAYIHGEATLNLYNFSSVIGWERLGGNGAIGFSTPLATLHKFQGFADVFLATPTAGLDDVYGTLAYTWKAAPLVESVKLFATYHTLSSERGNIDFGHEFDAGAAVKIHKYITAELKGAVYDGGSGGFADRSLIWASLRFQY